MLHCYIDESGHTGANLFDPVQPCFYTGAAIAPYDFDLRHPTLLRDIAQQHGLPYFHSTQLGLEKIAPHLPTLQALIKKHNIRFYLARVVKKDLVLAKFFDVFFDPHENRSVPWHVYWVLPMRFLLVLKLDAIVSDHARERFWEALMDPVASSATEKLLQSIRDVRAHINILPDARSRQLIGDALDWAEANREAITYHHKSKQHRLQHFPNLVVFSEMLHAFDRQSDHQELTVKEIKHDRQSEVQAVLQEWHKLLSNAGDGEVEIFGVKRKVRTVPNSAFTISRSADSTGIQLVDLVLWLKRKQLEHSLSHPQADAFLDRVDRQAEFFDLSREYTQRKCAEDLDDVYQAPWGEKEVARGTEFLAIAETRRQSAMKEYAENKAERL